MAWALVIVVSYTCGEKILKFVGSMKEILHPAWVPTLAVFYCRTPLQTEVSGEFAENFCYPSVLKIEENGRCYRITMGVMEWVFAKSNVFMRIVFAILIYSALSQRGAVQVIDAQTLSRALGWADKTVFYRLFVKYRKADNDLCSIIKEAVSAHVREVRNKALKVWLEDLRQDIEQVRNIVLPRPVSCSAWLWCLAAHTVRSGDF